MKRFAISSLLIGLIAFAVSISPLKASSDDPKSMDSLWLELEKGEREATRALLLMSVRPEESVAFLKKTMKPLKLEPQAAMDLIVKLESKDDKVWKPAFEQLEYFDPRLAISLQELMTDINIAPARQRLVEVLSSRDPGSLGEKEVNLRDVGDDGFNFFSVDGSWWAEHKVSRMGATPWSAHKRKWTRAVRAVVLLEHIGSADALAILKEMATGHQDAFPTKAAKEAVAGLEAKQKTK